ncbi:hypothetical protein BHM03_00043929 [Ensete ventricosum]|nr:hypothetical protein BHM03_00043929 [Ensete ventricosum]
MGGTYRSVRMPVRGPPGRSVRGPPGRPIRGPPATGRFRQKSTIGGRFRSSAVDFGRRRPIEGRNRPPTAD